MGRQQERKDWNTEYGYQCFEVLCYVYVIKYMENCFLIDELFKFYVTFYFHIT